MRAVLDTSVLIATDVPALDGELAISAASVAELHFGVLVARADDVRAERLRRLTRLRQHFSPLPVDDDVATHYGELAAVLARGGRPSRPRVTDLLVAATARAHQARLYTRNGGPFAGLDDFIEIVEI